MKLHLANVTVLLHNGGDLAPTVHRFDGNHTATLKGPWLIIEDSHGREVLITSRPVEIKRGDGSSGVQGGPAGRREGPGDLLTPLLATAVMEARTPQARCRQGVAAACEVTP